MSGASSGLKRTEAQWIALAKKRVLSILAKHKITYLRHLEIKISEAGPSHMRVEPVLLSRAVFELKQAGILVVYAKHKQMEFLIEANVDKRGLHNRLERIKLLYDDYERVAQLNHYCGLHFEKLLFETIMQLREEYMILGTGPTPNRHGMLEKVSGAEILYFEGKAAYGGAGFDVFLIHRATGIPIGIEAKNIRKWLYPDSPEIWRAIARACTFECLPLIASRKFAYTTRARLFSQIGMMGFETQFQFFSPDVHHISQHFPQIMHKDGLGYADIKIIDQAPDYFLKFFRDILPPNIESYYQRFMDNKGILEHYAITEKLAEPNTRSRTTIYHRFENDFHSEEEPDYDDGFDYDYETM